jgi:hypothetical protein
MFVQGAQISTGQAWGAGDVLCFAFDFVNGKWWYRVNGGLWNNVGTDDPATNTGGIGNVNGGTGEPMSLYVGFNSGGGNVTINTGTVAFAQTMPSGFSPWFASPATKAPPIFRKPLRFFKKRF